VVMADNTSALFAPGYPKLTSINGTAMKLEVALNESGAFVFSLRPGTNDSVALNRSQLNQPRGGIRLTRPVCWRRGWSRRS
jgi:hypothetical protein